MATLEETLGEVRQLRQGGRHAEAMARAEALLPEHPKRASIWGTVGELALEMRDWAQAKRALDTAIDVAQMAVPFAWRLGRLRALAGLGDLAMLRQGAAELAAEFPERASDVADLVQEALTEAGQLDALKEEIEGGVLRDSLGFSQRVAHMRALLALHQWDAAQPVFDAAMQQMERARDLATLLPLASRVFGQHERPARWQAMLARADALTPDIHAAAVATLRLRLTLALRDFAAFRQLHERREPLLRRWAERAAAAARLIGDGGPDRNAAKFFCIGFPGTGAAATCEALARMGFSVAFMASPFSGAPLEPDDADVLDAMGGRTVAAGFEVLYARYPQSRFILTLRGTDGRAVMAAPGSPKPVRFEGLGSGAALQRAMLVGGGANPRWQEAQADQAMLWPYADLATAYRAWNERVVAFFADKPGRLMQLNLFDGQGWPELAAFTGRPAPETPFPLPTTTS